MFRVTSARIGAISNWLAFMATLAVALAITPYLIRNLGTARYDVWCVAEAILAYFTVLDLGVAACLVRLTARYHTQQNTKELNKTAAACVVVYTLAAMVAIALGSVVLLSVSTNLSTRAGESVIPFLLLMLANVALALPFSVFPTLLEGLQRFTIKSMVKIFFLAIRTILIVFVVNDGYGLTALATVSLLSMVAEHLAMALLCKRILPGFALPIFSVTRTECRGVLRSSMNAFVAMVAGRVTVQAGAIFIGFMLPTGQVTAFATASRLVEYAKNLMRTVTATLTPGISAKQAAGDIVGIKTSVLRATKAMLYLVLPVNVGLWWFGRVFLQRWVGDEVANNAVAPLFILSASLTVVVAQSVFSRVLYGLGELKTFARLACMEAAITLLLIAVLLQAWGTIGVAIAVAVANVVFGVAVVRLGMKTTQMKLKPYLMAGIKPLLAVMVPFCLWFIMGETAITWVSLVSHIAMGLVAYGIAIVAFETQIKRLPVRLATPRTTSSPA